MSLPLKRLNICELNHALSKIIKPFDSSKINFRTKQILKWIYSKCEDDPDLFTDLSKEIRQQIKSNFTIRSLEIHEYRISKITNSIKFAFKTLDNEIVETVLMKHPDRYTICLSTQIGCNVGCVFCASGMFGLKRNLQTEEIIDQVFLVQKFLLKTENKKISNVVFMGMGEPLVNYENSIKALKIITEPWGFNVSSRNVTLSTSGIVPKIYQLVEDKVRAKLAISLHSPFQEQREKLIPISRRYKIHDVLKAAEYYYKNTKRRITIEYILIENINDGIEHAKELINILRSYDMKVWVNLIPYNSIGNVYFGDILMREPRIERIRKFESMIKEFFEVNVRWSLGRDIDGACGQLRRKLVF